MLKYRLVYLHLILVGLFLLPLCLKAADDISGGKVIFEDDVATAQKKSTERNDDENQNKAPVSQPVQGQAVTKPNPVSLPTDVSQMDSIEENIRPNFKKDKREAELDESTMFRPNEEQNLYGINLLVLRINVKRDKSGKIIGLLPENEKQPTTYINEKNNPDYYLNIEMNNYREKDYSKTSLYESHKDLLRSFVKRIPREQDAIVLMYMNGSNLKNYSDKEMQLEKTIYSQYVTNFLYRNKRKLIIEKRYVYDIPENEIFLIISRYEGNIPPNIYNASKGNILQWLARYKELERQSILNANSSRANLEKTLNSTTNTKNRAFLSTPINREVKEATPIFKIDEKQLFQKDSRSTPREDDTRRKAYTGPRRVLAAENTTDQATEESESQNTEESNSSNATASNTEASNTTASDNSEATTTSNTNVENSDTATTNAGVTTTNNPTTGNSSAVTTGNNATANTNTPVASNNAATNSATASPNTPASETTATSQNTPPAEVVPSSLGGTRVPGVVN